MRVLHVASEVAPFAQTGGLADVLAGLPAAQVESGRVAAMAAAPAATARTIAMPTRRQAPESVPPRAPVQAAVLVPLYRGVAARLAAAKIALDDGIALPLQIGPHAFEARLRRARVGAVEYGFLDCAGLYDRIGGLYGPTSSSEYTDNAVRFAALGRAALVAGERLLGGRADVLHVHDWQGGAASIYAHLERAERPGPPPAVVATIHNLAFRGVFNKTVMSELGFPWDLFTRGGVEFYDQLSLLKGGLAYADAVTTVSPSYAREILTPERGEGLDAFLRWDVARLIGIVNGIDEAAWDPRTDRAIAAGYSADDLAGKARCRAALLAETGLAPVADDRPVIAAISRMSDQKGLDLLADIVPQLGALGARLVVLGSGDPALEARWRYLAESFREHVAVKIGFDLPYARRVYAGSDLFVMPSRFEPCGLGQLYAMRYGSIPIVSSVGGLRDTVTDIGHGSIAGGGGRVGTGIRFDTVTAAALLAAIERGVKLVADRTAVAQVRRAAMLRDSSWAGPARDYVALYESLVARQRRGAVAAP